MGSARSREGGGGLRCDILQKHGRLMGGGEKL